jgi:outer membrane murein-binding lipoprotein Lpp
MKSTHYLSVAAIVLVSAIFSGCTQDPRVDGLQERLEAQHQEIAELREQLRIVIAANQEQAALRQSLEELQRKVAALEASAASAVRAGAGNSGAPQPRQSGVDINQSGETRALIIEVPQ